LVVVDNLSRALSGGRYGDAKDAGRVDAWAMVLKHETKSAARTDSNFLSLVRPTAAVLKRVACQLVDSDRQFTQIDVVSTVVSTFTLCTVPGIVDPLRAVRCVMRPTRKLIFFEISASPDLRMRRWQRRWEPLQHAR
jgi:hypothetical protein